jgi:hypothetical protein
MGLILRGNQTEKLTIEQVDSNFTYLEQLAQTGGATGPQGPTGIGTENTFTMSAHPSLTLADVGKWVMKYSDPDFEDFILNAGPTTSLDSYTGIQGVAKVVELTGSQSGSPGEWIFDLSQSYGEEEVNWETIIQNENNTIFNIQTNSNISFYVKNFNFQPSDPYLSSIVGSLSYTQSNQGWGTFSFPSDEESAAIMIEYYSNNGFPDSEYTADGRFGANFPYHISSTESYWTSATRNGTELNLTLDPSAEVLGGYDYVSVQFFSSFVDPNVQIEFTMPNTLQFQVLGILEDVSEGVAIISEIPIIYEFVVNEGSPTQTGTSSLIYTIPSSTNNEFSNLVNYWVVKEGGEELINFLTLSSQFNNENLSFNYLFTSPIYTPLYSGEVGTSIKFKKTNFYSN